MKRYWKITSLCIITAIVLGMFYIQSSLAKETTKIEFEKVSGNQGEISNLVLYADYEEDGQYQALQISNKETISLTNRSLIQQLTTNSVRPILKKLVEEHKNFMRGKELAETNFYEDEYLLVYADIKRENSYKPVNDFTFDFDIEALDKKTDKTISFQLGVSEKEKYDWMDVVDVQVIAGKIKVFARGFISDGGDDLKVYTFDLNEQKLVNDETIMSAPVVKNGWSDIRIINDVASTKQEKYLLIKVEAYEDPMVEADGEMVQGNTEPKLIADEIIIYNTKKNESKKLTVPDDLMGSRSVDSTTIFDSTIFIQNGSEVSQYNIEKEEWGKNLSFDFLDMKGDKDTSYIKLMEGKIYQVHSDENERTLSIGDVRTGKTLYEGKLKIKNQNEDQKNGQLFINDIEVVQ